MKNKTKRWQEKMLRICSSDEMRSLDAFAEKEFGLDAAILMENAGRAASQILLEHYPKAGIDTEILVFAGKGNNAGDAFVVARRLMCMDRRVRIFHMLEEKDYSGATAKNFLILKRLKAKMALLESASDLESFFQNSATPFTMVDGLLGTGLIGDLGGLFYDIVELINAHECNQVISLDIPTGVSGETGKVCGAAIQASVTISFGFPKLGHFLPPGAMKRGELINVDISLPSRFRHEGDKFLLMPKPMANLLNDRDRYGHKNAFGHTLLIGGSPGRLGAISMAAKACHRMGTGLVTVATWQDCFEALLMKLPDETMGVPLHLEGPAFEAYKRNLNNYSSIVIGPGLGQRSDAKVLMQELLLQYQGPLLIDADALNVISEHRLFDYLSQRRAPTVLTPHPGEMARILGISKERVTDNPTEVLREAVKLTHSTIVLKGAATLIAGVDEVIYLNHYPNDGMATAGSGDVLAGMIGGLLGQRNEPHVAALLGVYLHSVAGDFAARNQGHRSMTAPDIIWNISNAFKEIKENKGVNSFEPREGARAAADGQNESQSGSIGQVASLEGRSRLR